MKVTNWLIIGVMGLIVLFIGVFLVVSYQDKRVMVGPPGTIFEHEDYHPYYKCGVVALVVGLGIFVTSIVGALASAYVEPYLEKWLRRFEGTKPLQSPLQLPPPPVIYCRHCGAENRSDAKFCQKCGKRIAE
jgi:hypothetical protein